MPASQDITIRALQTDDFPAAAAILHSMNDETAEEILLSRLEEMAADCPNYTCLGAFSEGNLAGVAGYWIATKTWCGRYIEADNVVIHPAYRSQGIGPKLMTEIEAVGHAHDCNIAVLDSYTQNRASHRFYHRLGYEVYGFHFVKQLTPQD